MTHDIIRHLLDDYVTGDLDPEASAAVSDHITTCALCSTEVEGLREVLARAAELPRSIEPPGEAWANIRSVILEGSRETMPRGLRSRGLFRGRPLFTAIAAAVVVAVSSSGGTAAYMKYYMRTDNNNGRLATRPAPGSVPASLAAFTVEENDYLRTASRLQDILDQQEGALAPETVAQLRASLRTIDEAILEARSALARDPANKLLIEMLTANYRQKVDLLQRSTEMTRGS